MEEKKTESEWDEDESKQNKKWIESLGFEHLSVEDRRMDKEQRKTFMDWLTERSWRRYKSTSPWIFFMENMFFTQNNWNA